MADKNRELDARVAVARGWTDLKLETGRRTLGVEPMDDSGLPAINYIPNFSTDIAAAWALVEEMRAAGYDVTLKMDRIAPGRGLVACVVAILGDSGICTEAGGFIDKTGDTEQQAICLAYLEWKART